MNRLQILRNMADSFRDAAKAARGEGRYAVTISGPVECFERDAATIDEAIDALVRLATERGESP